MEFAGGGLKPEQGVWGCFVSTKTNHIKYTIKCDGYAVKFHGALREVNLPADCGRTDRPKGAVLKEPVYAMSGLATVLGEFL